MLLGAVIARLLSPSGMKPLVPSRDKSNLLNTMLMVTKAKVVLWESKGSLPLSIGTTVWVNLTKMLKPSREVVTLRQSLISPTTC